MPVNRPAAGRRRLVLGALCLAASASLARAGTIVDAKGVAVSASAPKRIVAIGSSVTEIVVGLGRRAALVAIDSTSIGVPGAAGLTDIGYMRALSAEGVLSQNPDLICATSDSGPPEVIDVLRASKVPFALIEHVPSVQGIVDKIEALGKLLDAGAEAKALARQVSGGAQALAAKVNAAAARPGVLFLLSATPNQLLAAGAGTAAQTVIEMAGGRNIAAAMSGYKPIAEEMLLASPPDVVVTMAAGGPPPSPEQVFALPSLAASPAARHRAFRVFDGAYLLGFGPRTVAAATELAALLHPELRL